MRAAHSSGTDEQSPEFKLKIVGIKN